MQQHARDQKKNKEEKKGIKWETKESLLANSKYKDTIELQTTFWANQTRHIIIFRNCSANQGVERESEIQYNIYK